MLKWIALRFLIVGALSIVATVVYTNHLIADEER